MDANVQQSLPRSLLSQHAEAAVKDQQNAGENDKHTATAATTPGPVRALRVEITTPAERSHAHKKSPVVSGSVDKAPCDVRTLCNKCTNMEKEQHNNRQMLRQTSRRERALLKLIYVQLSSVRLQQ